MDKNLKMGPGADEKFEKRDLEWTKSSKKWDLKVSDPLSLSLRDVPQGFEQALSASNSL